MTGVPPILDPGVRLDAGALIRGVWGGPWAPTIVISDQRPARLAVVVTAALRPVAPRVARLAPLREPSR